MDCVCKRCGTVKDCSEFRSRNVCWICRNNYIKILNKNWHINNKDRAKKTTLNWRSRNPDKVKLSSQKQYIKNKERNNKASREYCRKNRKILSKKETERVNNDINFKLRKRLRARLYVSIKLAKTVNSKSTLNLLGCSIIELKYYLESKFLPTMTWENYGKYWHIDHIIPCASFDLTKEEEQKKCFHYTNLQPLFAKTQIIDGIEYIGNLNKHVKILKTKNEMEN